MKAMGPSAIDIEIRSISVEMGGSIELLQIFLQFILYLLSTKKNFEIANAYLALFLKLHADTVSQEEVLVDLLEKIKEMQSLAWTNLEMNLNKNLCLVSYLKSVT
jgi:U3 small nucleolar RNA-associated protein 21